MNSPNNQKLITVFLVLAALTSSFVFLLSNAKTGVSTNTEADQSQGTSLAGQSAFTPETAQLQDYALPATEQGGISKSSDNLTDSFTAALAQQVVAANPEGPQKNASGKFALSSPNNSATDINNIISSFQVNPLPRIDASQIKIVTNYSKDDIRAYLSSVEDTLKTLGGELPDKAAYQSKFSKEQMDAINLSFVTATSKLYALNVPSPLAPFQETLLSSVSSQSSFFDTTDPLKSYAMISDAKDILAAQRQQLSDAILKLKNDLPVLLGKANDANGISARIASLLGVQKAYALFGAGDIVFDIPDTIQNVIDEIENTLSYALDTENSLLNYAINLLKDELIHRLTQMVITWAQGGGSPQFVTNWQDLLGKAFTGAANNLISAYAPGLCSNFQPLVTAALGGGKATGATGGSGGPGGVGYSAQNNPYTCTLDKALSNVGYTISDFQNNFANGGWAAYDAVLQPQNNFYGALVTLGGASTAAGQNAQTAAQSEAQSGSGFTGGQECAHTNPVDISIDGQRQDIEILQSDPDFITGTDCEGNLCMGAVFCDQYQTNTPGTTEAAATNNAVTESPIETIVNEDGLTGILSALANSALTKLVNSGKSGLLHLTSAQLADRSGSPSTLCAGMGSTTSTAYQNCIKQNGTIGTISAGASNASKGTVVNNLQQLITQENSVLSSANNTDNLIVQAIGALTQASSTCMASLSSSTNIDALNTLSFISNNLDQLQGTGGYLDSYNARIAELSAPPNGKINQLTDILSTVSSGTTSTILALANTWQITVPTTGTDAEKLAGFFQNFEQAMNNPASDFSSYFGSLPALVTESGTDAQFGQGISAPPKKCGILDQATALYNGNPPSCSIATAQKLCQ